MNRKPLVSILIPAFNSGEWIADTLRSAMEQNYREIEVVVVDDGSTDGTAEIAERTARAYPSVPFQLVRQPNSGASAARNAALRRSRGEYIQWLDADDTLSADKIEQQIAAVDGDPMRLLSCGWGNFYHDASKVRIRPSALWQDLSPAEWLLHKLNDNVYMQTATWLTSRKLAEAAGPWNETFSVDDDGEYFCRVLSASTGVKFVEGSFVYYRETTKGLSHINGSKKKMESLHRSMDCHIETLRSLEKSERVDQACKAYRDLVEGYIRFESVSAPRRWFRRKRWELNRMLGELLPTRSNEAGPQPKKVRSSAKFSPESGD